MRSHLRTLSAAMGQVSRQERELHDAQKNLVACVITRTEAGTLSSKDEFLLMLISRVKKEEAKLLHVKDQYYARLEETKARRKRMAK